MPSKSSNSRRSFLKKTASAAAAASPYVLIRSPRAIAQSPNNRIRVGAIGTSIYKDRYTGAGEHFGRGAEIGHKAAYFGEMVAVADVNFNNAKHFAHEYKGNCRIYTNYEDLLARDDIEAVTIGTPDHWHAKIAIDAMRAGKHVYCEKPMTLTIREGQQICQVARETGKTFQVGTQQRSEYSGIFLKAVAIAHSGLLGDKLDCQIGVNSGVKGGPFENRPTPEYIDWDRWLGQAPAVPYCPERGDFDFRWWLEYSGGQVTNWGAHHGDIAMWALKMDNSGPTKIAGTGDYPSVENGFNTAVTFDCRFEFEGGHTARLYSGESELVIGGDNGKIRVSRSGLTGKIAEDFGVAQKLNRMGVAPDAFVGGEGPNWMQDAIYKLCHGKHPGNHMKNFFDCIREGGMCISDPFSHHRSVSLCHLANISMRLGRPLNWDPANEIFTDDGEANSMIERQQREKYRIDVKV